MAAKFSLLPNESIIYKSESSVMHGGFMSTYTDDLVLTNLNIVYINKGIFGNVKGIQKFPVNQIKMFNGEPQAIMGKQQNGMPKLEIYFINGQQESFAFQSAGKKEVNKWINEICKLLTGHDKSSSVSSSKMSAIPGTEYLAETLKGTMDTFKGAFGIKSKEQAAEIPITKKCISCSAPLNGIKGQTVRCRYCDTDQVL